MISFNVISPIFAENNIEFVGTCAFSFVENHLIECNAKKRLPKNSKTVILCLFPYAVKEQSPKSLSRYAAVPDYHNVCLEYLNRIIKNLKEAFPQNEFEAFVDNSPIPEVYAAARAGLGIKGENGLLINEKYGSFVFIGEIVTDLEIETKNFEIKSCSQCGKCKATCPVGLDKAKCLSLLSQKKGTLSQDELKLLKDNNILWGCDICANVCPENKFEKTKTLEFIEGYKDTYSPLDNIEGRAFAWRGKKTIDRNYVNLYGLDNSL